MTKALTSSQVFLNEPTIEKARESYLKRWHLPSVQNAWTDDEGKAKKPSLAQFKKKFGRDYDTRQKWLARAGEGTSATALAVDEREEVVQQVAEGILEILQNSPEEENLGSLGDLIERLKRQKKPAEVTDTTEPPKFVKAENFDELPRSGQVYFFLHRAQEAGLAYAIVPVKRGIAAEAISQIKDDGRSYVSVATDLIKSK